MRLEEVRAELEEDLAWRLDEIRHLRNTLLGQVNRADWSVTAMRALLVMQYAHLEGFARNAFAIYVAVVNRQSLKAEEAHAHLFASALTAEFEALRRGATNDQEGEDGRLMRRAKLQVDFVERMRELGSGVLFVDVDSAVSMEMNFGADVLRRTLYRLGIPEAEVNRAYYNSLEFVRKMRNDIAHGSRKERIAPGEFEAHQRKCEEFMNELVRLVAAAIRSGWYRKQMRSPA
ncbi:MAE_28990/MAE_18760 family HEPN-like nuclease [Micromonospora chersina]|uniref:MAE_28990/MAE_18760 family HEPN-like nuclease n=1 Tax=Micromonospora chersina TaxID=47854 RepID=UPI0037166994